MIRSILLLSLLPLLTYAQQGPIQVVLKNQDTVYTQYVYLNNNTGFSGPNVRVHHKRGEKIPIDEIDHVEGRDQQGAYKYHKPVPYLYGGEIFAERNFSSPRIEIYFTHYVSGFRDLLYNFRYFSYAIDSSSIKKMSYANLKQDLADHPVSVGYLKQAQGYRTAQIVLYGVGGALVVHGIASGLSSNDELPPPGESRVKVPATLIIGAVALVVPNLLNNSKQSYFLKALKNYQ